LSVSPTWYLTGYENAAYVHEVDILQHRVPVLLWEHLLSSLPGHGPVYQIQIYIIHSEIVERILQGWCNVVWVVTVVPELGRDEEIFARDATLLDSSSNGFLGTVTTTP
jgi:hypothetical protein